MIASGFGVWLVVYLRLLMREINIFWNEEFSEVKMAAEIFVVVWRHSMKLLRSAELSEVEKEIFVRKKIERVKRLMLES